MNNIKVKIFYLNDERKPMRVRVMDKNYDCVLCTGDMWCTLDPAQGKLFELLIPEDAVVWVKKWQEMVMISYIYPTGHAQSAEALQPPVAE